MNKDNWIELEIGEIFGIKKSIKEKIFGTKNLNGVKCLNEFYLDK